MSKELDLLKEAVKMLEEKEKANKVELATLDCGDAFKLAGHDFIVLEHDYWEKAIRLLSVQICGLRMLSLEIREITTSQM